MAVDSRAKEITEIGDRLFAKKSGIDALNQEIALIYYPERASFTTNLQLGQDFASHNMDSFPALIRRELGNAISATLRPRDQPWFAATTLDEDVDNDPACARYLEYVTRSMRRSMYDARTKFVRSTKQGDHDFVTFGQAVLSVEEAPNRDHLFFRSYHLRDCAWLENELGEIDHLHRKERMTARAMARKFGDKKLAPAVKKALEKEPGAEFNVRVVVMPTDEYKLMFGANAGGKLPFTIVYVDADHHTILRDGGLPIFIYNVPRWHTISESQYAFSPATVTALPDGRMSQSLARILLEAGEKAVDPPMVATSEAVREVNLQAGAISWIDMDYDERLGEALRPVNINGDMRTGFQLRQDVREMLTKAFFIDKLALPEAGKQMTAYEIRTRLEEHVRNLLPLFEPMEVEYNVGLLDRAFILMKAMKQFDTDDMPDALSGSNITWSFKNPMQEASTRILVEQFQEALQIEAAAMQAGVTIPRLNTAMARDDALRGSGGPAKWRRSNEAVQADLEAEAQKAQVAAAAQGLAGGAEVAGMVGDAAQKLQGAGMLPAPAEASAGVAPPNVRPAADQVPQNRPMLRQVA